MAAYDPKRPRPAAEQADEPAPVEALLDPGDDDTTDDAELVVVESVSDELLVDDETGEVVGERIVTDDVVVDAVTGDVVAIEETVEQLLVDPETGEAELDVSVTEIIVDDTPDDTLDDDASAGSEDVEVDLRIVSSNGVDPAVGSDVPIAAAPEEGTANRAVVVAVGVAGLLAVLVALVLRRRRRSA